MPNATKIMQLQKKEDDGQGTIATYDVFPNVTRSNVFDNDGTNIGNNLVTSEPVSESSVGPIDPQLFASDIVDNLTSTATNKVLSANQGKVLEGQISTLNQNLTQLQTFAGNFKWQDNGAFSQLVQDGQTWLLFGNRPTAAGSIILIVNNYNNGTITVTEVLKSTSYTYETNNLGTVNLKYSNNTNLVASFAIRIK